MQSRREFNTNDLLERETGCKEKCATLARSKICKQIVFMLDIQARQQLSESSGACGPVSIRCRNAACCADELGVISA
jgi:hypothetical protein